MPFDEFKKKHGPPSEGRPVDPRQLAKYRSSLPGQLLKEWSESGWCAYGQGLIWTTDPQELRPVVRDWLGAKGKYLPFARSAFGQVFVWNSEGAHLLDPVYGSMAKIINNIDVTFDYVLCRKQYLEGVLGQKLFVKARKKLGALHHDECYGFEPAIALGGPGTLATLKKVKLREYLGVLREVTDRLVEM